MPRPSLSVLRTRLGKKSSGGVAGVDAPAFVERRFALLSDCFRLACVAGVDAPAFVERRARPVTPVPPDDVSPGLMPRPSLSAPAVSFPDRANASVAGVDAPAFVERPTTPRKATASAASVAGVDAPAFVERPTTPRKATASAASVAGVDAPAFVERSKREVVFAMRVKVSPGLMPRPSLSEEHRNPAPDAPP